MIRTPRLIARSGDDFRYGFSNDGTLALRLTFTDGSSGIFTATIPKPTALVPLAAAAAVPRRRRGR